MKKFSFLILSILLIASCSSNGLKKSITEPLSVDELKANIKKDTTFTDFYSEIQKIREWIIGNDVRQAKYGEPSLTSPVRRSPCPGSESMT